MRDVPPEDQAATPLLFLTGRGQLLRDFVVSYTTLPPAPPDTVALKLVPRRQERDYDWLTLVVDRQSLSLRMLVAGDSQGGVSTFSFSNLRENTGLRDGNFTFKVPRGADITYFYTLRLDQIPDYQSYEDAWLQYQFVASTVSLTVLGRSIVSRDEVSLTHCTVFSR